MRQLSHGVSQVLIVVQATVRILRKTTITVVVAGSSAIPVRAVAPVRALILQIRKTAASVAGFVVI